MIVQLILQLAAPMLMMAWLLIAPASSRVGLAVHVISFGTWLLAIALCGVWTSLPWWTPYLLGAASAAALAWRLPRLFPMPVLPDGWRAWSGAALCLLIASIALLQVAAAINGRQEPVGWLADIGNPLQEGTFLVVNGGSDASVNAHIKTLSPDVPRFRAWRGQSYGIDIIRIGRTGFRSRGLRPPDPSDYAGFGSKVLAPCGGFIVRAVDGIADNLVPQVDREHMAGNYVIVRCDGFDLVLAHLRRGSVVVRPGDYVKAGHGLGELGNSGNSDEPHLHVHAQRTTPVGAPFAADPVPLRINGRFLLRNDRLIGGVLDGPIG